MAEISTGYGHRSQMVAKYKCPACDHKWKKKNSSGRPSKCERCDATATAYKYRPAKPNELVHGRSSRKVPRRMFGEFYCKPCDRTWFSGNAWEGKGQQCLSCKRLVQPLSLRPLEFQGASSDSKKPHVQELCEMCKSLGFSCVGYKPPIEEKEQDYPDDVSVISSASSTSSASTTASEVEPDEQTTPMQSDEEESAQDALLEKVLKWKIEDPKPD